MLQCNNELVFVSSLVAIDLVLCLPRGSLVFSLLVSNILLCRAFLRLSGVRLCGSVFLCQQTHPRVLGSVQLTPSGV